MMRKLAITLCLAAATTLATAPAHAGKTEEARALFNAGAQAYKNGDFQGAIQAFVASYKVEPRMGVFFSIAQAHRHQYAIDQNPARVVEALRLYREYLLKVDSGGRRVEATAAIAELEPIVQRLEQAGQLHSLAPLAPERGTRLLVSCPVDGAALYLDDDPKPRHVSVSVELSPGKHVVRVQAPGYSEERREIEVAAGAVTAIDLPLRGLPARIAPAGLDGAQVTVDQRPVGVTPFASPVEVTPGRRLVRFSRAGYAAYEVEVDVTRGATTSVTAVMPRTRQRTAAWVLMFGGGAAVAAGAVLGVGAGLKEASASSLKGQIDTGTLYCPGSGCATLSNYNAALDSRDRLSLAAGTAGGIGLAVLGAGVLLYTLDEPARPLPPRDQAPAPGPAVPTEVTASPMIGPGFYGAALGARF